MIEIWILRLLWAGAFDLTHQYEGIAYRREMYFGAASAIQRYLWALGHDVHYSVLAARRDRRISFEKTP
jgi:hypothetical protein